MFITHSPAIHEQNTQMKSGMMATFCHPECVIYIIVETNKNWLNQEDN